MNESERNSERGSAAQADSQLASEASSPTIFGGALNTALAGASAGAGACMTEQAGKESVPSDPINPGTSMAGLAYFDPSSDA